MTFTEALFTIGNVVVLPFWALMILLPRWKWTPRIISSSLVVLPPALCYVLLLGSALTAAPVQLTPDLPGIMALLATPVGTAATWLHLLTFDLFVGRWVYLERRKRNANALVTSVILLFVFLAGPLGFLLYLLASKLESRRVSS
jgi:hypothetical protein